MELEELKKSAEKAGLLVALIAFLIWLFSPTDGNYNRK
jgi:hypothetical protein